MSEEPRTTDDKRQVPCDVYSRIVGYITPVGQWNTGKQREMRDRKVYRVPEEGDGEQG
jgi:ribonucleoside-triphosphate reductase